MFTLGGQRSDPKSTQSQVTFGRVTGGVLKRCHGWNKLWKVFHRTGRSEKHLTLQLLPYTTRNRTGRFFTTRGTFFSVPDVSVQSQLSVGLPKIYLSFLNTEDLILTSENYLSLSRAVFVEVWTTQNALGSKVSRNRGLETCNILGWVTSYLPCGTFLWGPFFIPKKPF